MNKEKGAEDYTNSIITLGMAATLPFTIELIPSYVTIDHLELSLYPHHSIWKEAINIKS
jgi:hypothetical protein